MSGALAQVMGRAPGKLTVTISAGSQVTANSSSHTFSANTCTASGGSGTYTYAWSSTSDIFGTWTPTSGSSASLTPAVANVNGQTVSTGYYVCVVTDTVSGEVHASNTASYSLTNLSPAV